MRVVTYESQRGARAGLLAGDRVVDAWDAIAGPGSTVRELLESGRLGELVGADGPGITLAEARLRAPVPDPDKIIGIGLNYKAHAAPTCLMIKKSETR